MLPAHAVKHANNKLRHSPILGHGTGQHDYASRYMYIEKYVVLQLCMTAGGVSLLNR